MAVLVSISGCAAHKPPAVAPANSLAGEYQIVSMDVSICGKTGTMPVKGKAYFRNDYTFEVSFSEFLLGTGDTVTVGGLYMVKNDSVTMIFKEPTTRWRQDATFTFDKKRLNLVFVPEEGSQPLKWIFKRE